MASALFARAVHKEGIDDARSASAGFLEGGRPVHDSVTQLLDERGVDVSRKLSQELSADVVSKADLILTMTSEHARGVVSRFPDVIGDVYTQRHFGKIVTPRSADTSIDEWLDDLNRANRRAYLSDDEMFDIPDPIGHNHKVFTELAVELENSIDWILGCAFPVSNVAQAG